MVNDFNIDIRLSPEYGKDAFIASARFDSFNYAKLYNSENIFNMDIFKLEAQKEINKKNG